MNKKTETWLIIGGIGITAYYLWYKSQQSATAAAAAAAAAPASSSATSTAVAPVSTAAQSEAPTPVLEDDPVQDLKISIVNANAQQQPTYLLALELMIQNTGPNDITLDSLSGSITYAGVTADYATLNPPAAPAGNLGTLSISSPITIPAGQTGQGWYQVSVPKTPGANYYLTTLANQSAYAASHGTGKGAALTLVGTVTIEGSSVPLSLSYFP